MNEGMSMESIDLATPRSFYDDHQFNTSKTLESNLHISGQLDFNCKTDLGQNSQTETSYTTNMLREETMTFMQIECNQITSTNGANVYANTFQPDATMPCNLQPNPEPVTLIPIAQTVNTSECSNNNTITIASSSLNTELELIAVPVQGQPNCFQLAKIVKNPENVQNLVPDLQAQATSSNSSRAQCNKSPEIDDSNNYVSVKRNVIADYIKKFKSLQHAQDNKITSTTADYMESTQQNRNTGFTQYQYDLMQQQLRIHIQLLTQTFVQTYCHPELWKLAPKPKSMLLELEEKAKENVNFQVWNLKPAVELIQNWQSELDQDTAENTELMDFLHYENFVTLVTRKETEI